MCKECSTCNINKALTEFSIRTDSKDGYRDQCKSCMDTIRKHRAERNKLRNTAEGIDSSITKTCLTCRETKDATEFPLSLTRKDGIHPHCILCTSIRNKEYYDNNPEKVRNMVKEYRLANIESVSASNAAYKKTPRGKIVIQKSNSKRRALKHTTVVEPIDTINFAKDKPFCFWCNKIHQGKYHIDHFYPLSRGGTHTLDNIVIACPSCNLKKHAKDPEVFAEEIGKGTYGLFAEDFHEW